MEGLAVLGNNKSEDVFVDLLKSVVDGSAAENVMTYFNVIANGTWNVRNADRDRVAKANVYGNLVKTKNDSEIAKDTAQIKAAAAFILSKLS